MTSTPTRRIVSANADSELRDIAQHLLQDNVVTTGVGSSLVVAGLGQVGFDVVIAATATVTFQGRQADGTWRSLLALNLASGRVGSTATASGHYLAAVGNLIEVRANVTATTGAVSVSAIGLPQGGFVPRLEVGFDQTTNGTTNGVWLNSALNPTDDGVRIYGKGGASGTPGDTPVLLFDSTDTAAQGSADGAVKAIPHLYYTTGQAAPQASASGAGSNSAPAINIAAATSYQYNNATYEAPRTGYNETILTSAANTSSPTITDRTTLAGIKGAILTLNVTAAGGGAGIVFRIQYKDNLGNYVYLNAAPAAITSATGVYAYRVYPGAGVVTGTGITQHTDASLPRLWRPQVEHSGSESFTYTLTIAWLP